MVKKRRIKTILIIEDEAEVRYFASRVLELDGYRTLGAETAEDGLRLARGGGISLVLLDLRLPGRDGWAVLAMFRDDPELSMIPVVLFTASAGVPQRDRALAMGAADYLVKPVSAGELREAVGRVLRRKRRR